MEAAADAVEMKGPYTPSRSAPRRARRPGRPADPVRWTGRPYGRCRADRRPVPRGQQQRRTAQSMTTSAARSATGRCVRKSPPRSSASGCSSPWARRSGRCGGSPACPEPSATVDRAHVRSVPWQCRPGWASRGALVQLPELDPDGRVRRGTRIGSGAGRAATRSVLGVLAVVAISAPPARWPAGWWPAGRRRGAGGGLGRAGAGGAGHRRREDRAGRGVRAGRCRPEQLGDRVRLRRRRPAAHHHQRSHSRQGAGRAGDRGAARRPAGGRRGRRREPADLAVLRVPPRRLCRLRWRSHGDPVGEPVLAVGPHSALRHGHRRIVSALDREVRLRHRTQWGRPDARSTPATPRPW